MSAPRRNDKHKTMMRMMVAFSNQLPTTDVRVNHLVTTIIRRELLTAASTRLNRSRPRVKAAKARAVKSMALDVASHGENHTVVRYNDDACRPPGCFVIHSSLSTPPPSSTRCGSIHKHTKIPATGPVTAGSRAPVLIQFMQNGFR